MTASEWQIWMKQPLDSIVSSRVRPWATTREPEPAVGDDILPLGSQFAARLALTLIAVFFCFRAAGVPFAVQGAGVNSNDFRITTFASGLDFPLGMARLSDASLLVAINQGTSFFNSTGKLLRLVDANEDGIADDQGSVLYGSLPGSQTAVRVAGSLILTTGQRQPITVLRTGPSPGSPLALVGRIIIAYPGSWYHPNSALELRKTPGQTNSFDLLFQLGSDSNFAVTTRTASLTNDNIPGATGVLPGDSAFLLTITDNGTNVTARNLTHLASGLRNAAGFAFHPTTGDLYFQDNGIDGLVNANEPLSADELNFIARSNLGGLTEHFGFPSNYTAYRTGTVVGGADIQPLIAFQPIPSPSTGRESEGPNDIVFAPPGFPNGLNTGVFIGFHGKFNGGGTNNEENPVVYANPATGDYFHFIQGQQTGVGHLDGLLATRDSLFVADLVTTGNTGNGAGAGAIYQIKSLVSPPPPAIELRQIESRTEVAWDRGVLQEAEELAGPWNDVVDAFSPYLIQPIAPRKFFRTRY
jgi:glucose/arabinose dehydrogenase